MERTNPTMDSKQSQEPDHVETGWRHFTLEWHLKNLADFRQRGQEADLECHERISVASPDGTIFKFVFTCSIDKKSVCIFMKQLEGPASVAYVRCDESYVAKVQFHLLGGGAAARGDSFDCDLPFDDFDDPEYMERHSKIALHCSVRVCPVTSLFDSINLYDRNEEWQAEKDNLISNALASMYDDCGIMPLADVKLLCEGGSIKCHRLMLSAWSDVFRAMFSHETLKEAQSGQVEIKDCSLKALKLFVEYIYKGRGPLEKKYRYSYPLPSEGRCFKPQERDPRDLLDLYVLADKYQVRVIANHARHLLSNAIYCSLDFSAVYCALRTKEDGSCPWQYQFYSMLTTSIDHGMEDITESLLHCLYMEDDAEIGFQAENPLKKLNGWPQFAQENPEIGSKVNTFFEEKDKRPVTTYTTDLNNKLSSSESESETETDEQ